MNTKQALVTCGGAGFRLRKAGMKFPLSKSFIELEGRPMLYWCLLGLHYAGVEKLVIIGDGTEKIKRAKEVLSDFPYDFSQVSFHEDSGLGSNGLPYQARHLLDDLFFFECGHSMSEPEHYHRLEDELKDGDVIVLSRFKPNPYAPRSFIKIENSNIIPIPNLTGADNEFSVGSPRLLNRKYIDRLPELDFDLHKILEFYTSRDLLRLVPSDLPIEVDVIEEWKEAVPIYQRHIEQLSARAQTSPNSANS